MFRRLLALLLTTIVASIVSVALISCSQPQSLMMIEVPVTVEVEVTREALVTVEIEREIEVTREVPATVEVEPTVLATVEVEREVLVTREVPVTVEVERTVLTMVEFPVTVEVPVPYEVLVTIPKVTRDFGSDEMQVACAKFNEFQVDPSVTFEGLVDFLMDDTFYFSKIWHFMVQEMFRSAISSHQVAEENDDQDDWDQFNRSLGIIDHYCNEVLELRRDCGHSEQSIRTVLNTGISMVNVKGKGGHHITASFGHVADHRRRVGSFGCVDQLLSTSIIEDDRGACHRVGRSNARSARHGGSRAGGLGHPRGSGHRRDRTNSSRNGRNSCDCGSAIPR